jgi:hypothetical protein
MIHIIFTSCGCSVIHRLNCPMLEFEFGKSIYISGFATRSGDLGFGGSMGGWRVRRPVSGAAKTLIPLAAKATSCPHFKIPFLVVFATLLVVLAAPILFRANIPSVTADSTLKCYDSAGNYEPCATRASASRSQFNGRTTRTQQPPSWTTTALYQQTIWPTTALDKSAIWPGTAVDEPADWTRGAAARRSSMPGKRSALVTCRRRLVPCFFSALRRGLTQIASVAVGQVRRARERL